MKRFGIEAGKVRFQHRRLVDGDGQYIKVPHTLEPHQLFHMMCLTRHVGWQLIPPSLILSVTGSAQDMSLRRRFYDNITRAIVMVSKKTRAWIVDGGTEVGHK